MNKPHVHADMICEWARTGKQVQIKNHDKNIWEDCEPTWFHAASYRLKPEIKRYRVALFADGPMAATTEDIEVCHNFIRWLTYWVEYEV